MTAATIPGPVVPVLRHAGASSTCGTFIPEDDSPPVVFVGALASAERVEALASRHGLDVAMLLAFARAGLPRAG